tara:strand:+ start:75 stop:776 length:702 start_codon:yes stop_codon:yes gene_type:complete
MNIIYQEMKSSIINRINLELSLYGFSVINPDENIFKDKYLKKFQDEMRNIKLDHNNKKYPGGDLLTLSEEKIKNDENFSQYKEFDNSNKIIIDLMKIKKDYKLYSIFRTLDTRKSNHVAQTPHFDKLPTLKFMLYINDIEESNGSFCLSPGSHKWVDETFGKYRFFERSKNYNKISREIPKEIINKLQPINGKAGTIIIFYTNCVHNQGIVEEGSCNIVRAHYRRHFLNFKLK